jgi:hypothetical protein
LVLVLVLELADGVYAEEVKEIEEDTGVSKYVGRRTGKGTPESTILRRRKGSKSRGVSRAGVS